MKFDKGDKKIINAWTFYDWANSSYPLVITTAIFPIFYDAVTTIDGSKSVSFFGMNFENTVLYSYVVGFSFLVVSLTVPFLSGIADYSGNKKRFMQFFCYLGSLSCASLFFFSTDHLVWSMLSVLLASVGFWGSLVFYNAYLPEIADITDHDKISARGFSMGYMGGSLLLIICILFIQLAGAAYTNYSFVFVALWWAGFAQVTFARIPNNVYNRTPEGNIVFKGFKELYYVWTELKENKRLKRFLGSFFIYSMGVQTVLLMAVLFAKSEIPGISDSQLIISVLLIQFVGIGGSMLFSRLSKWIGNIKALGVAIFIWIGICVGTYAYVYTPNGFYMVAVLVGLVMGGIQSLSRSTYSKLLPETKDHASYFSFYDVSEKIGIVIGMFSYGTIESMTGSMRNSVLALITFFVIGFLILLTIPKTKAIES